MAVSFLSQGSLMVLAGEATPAEAAPAEAAPAEAAGTMLTGEQEILPAEEVFFESENETAVVPEDTVGAGVEGKGEAADAAGAAEQIETPENVPEAEKVGEAEAAETEEAETEEAEKAEEAEEEEMLLRDPEPYLAVGGKPVTVTGTGIVDVFGDGKAVYDPNTKTLTLKNADYTSGMHASGAAVVSVSLDLTIKGSGKLTGSGYGIFVRNGSLTLDGADITAVATDHSGGDDAGIFADKNITIKNSTVKASAEDFGIYETRYRKVYAGTGVSDLPWSET